MKAQMVALGDLYQIGSSKRVLKSQWKTEGVPFYRGREITRLAADGFVENELFISEEHFAELAAQSGVPNTGDIVITAIGTIGNAHIVRDLDRFYFKDASVLWMKRTSDVSSEFINLWLKSPLFFDQLDRGNGATVDTLTIQKLQSVRLCIPTPAEQQRIVAILDEAFASIDRARAAAEQNRQNARALFESHLQSVFSQQGEGWREATVGQLVRDGVIAKPQDGNHGEIHPTKADYVEVGIPFVMAADLLGGRVDTKGCRFISEQQARSLRIGFSVDQDVLLSHKGTIGRVAILEADQEFVMLTPQVTYYRVLKKSEISNHYLYFYFHSPKFRSQIEHVAGAGSTRAYIGITKQLDLKILLPPIAIQQQLAVQLKGLQDESRHLESLYMRKLTALDELKQSLLHQAFSGNL